MRDPNRIAKPLPYTLIKPDGSRTTIHSAAHSANPSVNYWKIEEGLQQHGFLKVAPFGQADTMVLRAGTLRYAAGCLSVNRACLMRRRSLINHQYAEQKPLSGSHPARASSFDQNL